MVQSILPIGRGLAWIRQCEKNPPKRLEEYRHQMTYANHIGWSSGTLAEARDDACVSTLATIVDHAILVVRFSPTLQSINESVNQSMCERRELEKWDILGKSIRIKEIAHMPKSDWWNCRVLVVGRGGSVRSLVGRHT